MIVLVYIVALAVAYMIPSYRSNPYLVWALPLGMLYSALFMLAGIIQTPLQLYRKMEQVSV
jgi:O-antigen/teichoic acid export membrane protein